MGTDGTVEITVGADTQPPIAWWYREPPLTRRGTRHGVVPGSRFPGR